MADLAARIVPAEYHQIGKKIICQRNSNDKLWNTKSHIKNSTNFFEDIIAQKAKAPPWGLK
jgi:hypothetical protein